MIHLALALFADQEMPAPQMWAFLTVGAIALFVVFLPVTSWLETRRKEREAYYRSEMIRRIAEASGEGAKAALELLREEEHLRQIRKLEGLKIGGLINVAVGVGLSGLLWGVTGGTHGPFLVGLIPGLIGVALLVYAFFLAEPI